MKVSVVIPAYNAAPFIRRTLDSVLTQTWKDLEVIVVDDGSVDATREVVSAAGGPIVLVSGSRRGVSAARNTGVRVSRGEFVAFLDHDDLWEPDKVRLQVAALEADPDAALAFTQCRVEEGSRGGGVFPVIADTAAFLAAAHLNLLHWNYIPMSSVMARRSALDEAEVAGADGPFDTRFGLSEDWDLWLRIAARRAILFIAEPLMRYVIVPGRATERMADLRIEDITIFREQTDRHPALVSADPARARASLYRLNEEAGYWLLQEGRAREARRYLVAAWRLRPTSLKPPGYLIASLLGKSGAPRRRRPAPVGPPPS